MLEMQQVGEVVVVDATPLETNESMSTDNSASDAQIVAYRARMAEDRKRARENEEKESNKLQKNEEDAETTNKILLWNTDPMQHFKLAVRNRDTETIKNMINAFGWKPKDPDSKIDLFYNNLEIITVLLNHPCRPMWKWFDPFMKTHFDPFYNERNTIMKYITAVIIKHQTHNDENRNRLLDGLCLRLMMHLSINNQLYIDNPNQIYELFAVRQSHSVVDILNLLCYQVERYTKLNIFISTNYGRTLSPNVRDHMLSKERFWLPRNEIEEIWYYIERGIKSNIKHRLPRLKILMPALAQAPRNGETNKVSKALFNAACKLKQEDMIKFLIPLDAITNNFAIEKLRKYGLHHLVEKYELLGVEEADMKEASKTGNIYNVARSLPHISGDLFTECIDIAIKHNNLSFIRQCFLRRTNEIKEELITKAFDQKKAAITLFLLNNYTPTTTSRSSRQVMSAEYKKIKSKLTEKDSEGLETNVELKHMHEKKLLFQRLSSVFYLICAFAGENCYDDTAKLAKKLKLKHN